MKHKVNFRFNLSFILVLLLFIIMSSSSVLANTSGPNYPGIGTSVTAGVGTHLWLNPAGISVGDSSYASVEIDTGGSSEYLQGTNFGFTIPNDATIDGIEVEIDRFAGEYSTSRIQDKSVHLLKDGMLVGENKAEEGKNWPRTMENKSYGGVNDLWEETWTPADINSIGFGAALSVKNTSTISSRPATVDYIRIMVTYTLGSNLTTDSVEIAYGEPISLTATLTSPIDDTGIINKQISFSLNGETACEAITDLNGVASCPTTLLVNADTYQNGVSAVFSGDVDFTASTSSAGLIVNKKELTVDGITAENKIYDGTTTAMLNIEGVDLIGVVGSEVVGLDVENASGAFVDANVAVGKVVKVSGLTLTGNDDVLANYILIDPTATAEIKKKTVSVKPDAASKVYGEEDPTFTGELSGFLGADTVSASYVRTVGEEVVGSPYTISASLSPTDVLENYEITYNTTNFIIEPRQITVKADDKTKTIGKGDPALTYSITEGSFAFTDELSGQLARDAGEATGDYAIRIGTLSASNNYLMKFVEGTFTITPQPIVTVTVDKNQSKVYGDADPVFTYSSDQVVEFSGELGRGAGENVGSYAINRGSLSAEGYKINFVPENFTITRKAASVTPDSKTKIIGDPDPVHTGTLSGFLMSDAVTASFGRTTGEAEGTYVISATLSPNEVLGNYDISYNTANFTIIKKPAFNLYLPLLVR